MGVNHGTCNRRKMLDIFQFEVMTSHFMNPPENLWKNFRYMFPKNKIEPLSSNSGVQNNQIRFKSSINCFLALCRKDLSTQAQHVMKVKE